MHSIFRGVELMGQDLEEGDVEKRPAGDTLKKIRVFFSPSIPIIGVIRSEKTCGTEKCFFYIVPRADLKMFHFCTTERSTEQF